MANVTWALSPRHYARYTNLLDDLLREEEWSDRYQELLDEIKTLPGFPVTLHEERDTLHVVRLDAPRVGYTG